MRPISQKSSGDSMAKIDEASLAIVGEEKELQKKPRVRDQSIEAQGVTTLAQAPGRPARSIPILMLVLQAGLVIAFVWLATSLFVKIDNNQTQMIEQVKETRLLNQQATAMNAEIITLRKYIASHTSEDILYLKILILKSDVDPKIAKTIAKHIHHYSEIYSQDPDLVLAIMYTESLFKPDVVSNKGAVGLMQVMPLWKKVLGITGDLKDPETSIKFGLQILGFYKEMYKENEMAITAYNRGPGPVDMALMRGKDHRNGYSDKVLKTYEWLKTITVDKI